MMSFSLPFFIFVLNITASGKNEISHNSVSDMTSKELESSRRKIFSVNLITNVFKIIAKYCRNIFTKYCQI